MPDLSPLKCAYYAAAKKNEHNNNIRRMLKLYTTTATCIANAFEWEMVYILSSCCLLHRVHHFTKMQETLLPAAESKHILHTYTPTEQLSEVRIKNHAHSSFSSCSVWFHFPSVHSPKTMLQNNCSFLCTISERLFFRWFSVAYNSWVESVL